MRARGARSAQLLTGSSAARIERRIQPNAATATLERLNAAVAARDLDVMANGMADDFECISHPTGTTFGREILEYWRAIFTAETLTYPHELLASLGKTLMLCRGRMSLGGLVADGVSFGPSSYEEVVLTEVDAQGEASRVELFASDRLGDAVARLYARHAELLPAGLERRRRHDDRALAGGDRPTRFRSRAVAVRARHRVRRSPPVGSRVIPGRRRLLESGREYSSRLAEGRHHADRRRARRPAPTCCSGAATLSGTDRTSGGPFENPMLALRVFSADGLQTHLEWFDVDHAAKRSRASTPSRPSAPLRGQRGECHRISPPKTSPGSRPQWPLATRIASHP